MPAPGNYCIVMHCIPNLPVSHAGPHIDGSAQHCTVYATCCFIVSWDNVFIGTSHTRMGLESSLLLWACIMLPVSIGEASKGTDTFSGIPV